MRWAETFTNLHTRLRKRRYFEISNIIMEEATPFNTNSHNSSQKIDELVKVFPEAPTEKLFTTNCFFLIICKGLKLWKLYFPQRNQFWQWGTTKIQWKILIITMSTCWWSQIYMNFFRSNGQYLDRNNRIFFWLHHLYFLTL